MYNSNWSGNKSKKNMSEIEMLGFRNTVVEELKMSFYFISRLKLPEKYVL
jgi:hypothetical protein